MPRSAVFSFIAPSSGGGSLQNKRSLAKALQRHRWFDEGELLDTMEKGVLYPIIHIAEVCPNGNKPPMALQDPSALGQDFTLQQGLFTEIKFSSPLSVNPSAHENDLNNNKACIVLGFRKLDSHFSEVLEDSWKDWTGARTIYLNLADEFGLSRLSFFRRVAPRDAGDMFMYLVTVRCGSVTRDNRIRLLDFVQRLRVERMMGYLSVYEVQQRLSTPISGLLAEGDKM